MHPIKVYCSPRNNELSLVVIVMHVVQAERRKHSVASELNTEHQIPQYLAAAFLMSCCNGTLDSHVAFATAEVQAL